MYAEKLSNGETPSLPFFLASPMAVENRAGVFWELFNTCRKNPNQVWRVLPAYSTTRLHSSVCFVLRTAWNTTKQAWISILIWALIAVSAGHTIASNQCVNVDLCFFLKYDVEDIQNVSIKSTNNKPTLPASQPAKPALCITGVEDSLKTIQRFKFFMWKLKIGFSKLPVDKIRAFQKNDVDMVILKKGCCFKKKHDICFKAHVKFTFF